MSRYRTTTLDGSTGRRVTGHTVYGVNLDGFDAATTAIRRRYRLAADAHVEFVAVREYSTGTVAGDFAVYLADAPRPAHTGAFVTLAVYP